MSKPEKPATDTDEAAGFLSRWARRKAEAREAGVDPEVVAQAPSPEDEPFDPAVLPPIDSLTAESDFSLFLKKGVPAPLRAAALRKLWLVEPSVLNYQPLVEYNWDFTAPGYGDLLPTDDVAKMLRTVFEGSRGEEVAPAEATPDDADKPPAAEAPPALEAPPDTSADHALTQVSGVESEAVEAGTAPFERARRRHGGALPS